MLALAVDGNVTMAPVPETESPLNDIIPLLPAAPEPPVPAAPPLNEIFPPLEFAAVPVELPPAPPVIDMEFPDPPMIFVPVPACPAGAVNVQKLRPEAGLPEAGSAAPAIDHVLLAGDVQETFAAGFPRRSAVMEQDDPRLHATEFNDKLEFASPEFASE